VGGHSLLNPLPQYARLPKFLMLKLFQSPTPKAKPRLPNGVRVYAVGDIHGCAHLLEQMLKVIDADLARSKPHKAIEVFLGDYIDRGPDSRATLDILIARSRVRNTVFLKGNHEAYLIEVLREPSKMANWQQYGGLQTLISYGLKPSLNPDRAEQVELVAELAAVMPATHKRFLHRLRLNYTCGDFFFVHAGVRPGVALADQQEADLLWIRNEFLDSTEDFGKYIVHGHTPVRAPDIRPNRINIDTGAYATGNLTLLSVQGSSMLAI
jgi:diadenosine tetraphosphatase ApaH/serine/threonine PP2A family protein phosphatase